MQITVRTTPVYRWNKEAYLSGKYRVIANQGSTRSSKTYSICQLLALYIPIKKKKSISIVGPSLPHLKRGARRDFISILEGAGLYHDSWFNKTDNIYRYPNGSYVEFIGADEAGKARGPGRDILFVNECNLISRDIYTQFAIRTNDVIFIDFNPVEESSYVYDIADAPGNTMIHSTYRNNRKNLSQEIIDEIERLKDVDENLWNVFGLGLRGKSENLIYPNFKMCESLPERGELLMGLDFGYNVPTALVAVELYEGAIYVDELIYETKLTTAELIEKLKSLNISRSKQIFCDSAEPKTIEELFRAGFNAKPAEKDVTEGIRCVKSMPMYVTKKSSNIVKELKSYKWMTNKEGRRVKDKDKDEPVKFMDHAMDAIRYAVFTRLHRPAFRVVAY